MDHDAIAKETSRRILKAQAEGKPIDVSAIEREVKNELTPLTWRELLASSLLAGAMGAAGVHPTRIEREVEKYRRTNFR